MKKILICGGLLIDRYLSVDKYPSRGGDGYITDSFDVVGGCSVNMAKTVKNLGANPYIVSYAGNDPWGDKIIAFMESEKLPVDCVRRTDGSTGYCFVFLEPDGERTFLTYKGCETKYSDSLTAGAANVEFCACAITGYYLLDETSVGLFKRIKELKAGGCPIVFDPSPLIEKIPKNYIEDILSICDAAVPNESEAKTLAALLGYKTPEEWAYNLSKRGVVVIVTRGGAGGALYKDGEKTTYVAVNANVADTTGAGDSFTGAIAYALGNGVEPEKAVTLAASAAAVTASVKGPHGYFDLSCLTPEAQAVWKESRNGR